MMTREEALRSLADGKYEMCCTDLLATPIDDARCEKSAQLTYNERPLGWHLKIYSYGRSTEQSPAGKETLRWDGQFGHVHDNGIPFVALAIRDVLTAYGMAEVMDCWAAYGEVQYGTEGAVA